MKRSRPWFLLLLALTSGGIAAVLALRYIRDQATPLMAAEGGKVNIVLTARPIPVGAIITGRDVKLVGWPDKAVPGGFLGSVDEAIGRGVITPLTENEPVLAGKISTREAGGGLPIIIRDGMRALSVPVDEIIGVAGFVTPGTHVDVLLTLPKGENRPQPVTRTILQNVQTLAAGQSVQKDKEGKPQTVTVITLLVTLDDAELLALAGREGRIQLALRNTLDTLSIATSGARADQLSPSWAPSPRPRVASPNRAPAPSPRSDATVIEGYRGGERTLTTFQKP